MNAEPTAERVDFDPETETYRAAYAYPSEPPSIAVPLALTEVTDSDDVTALDPIREAAGIDPDALDELFRPTANGSRREGSVTFPYHGYSVTVRGRGRIVIRESVAEQSRVPG